MPQPQAKASGQSPPRQRAPEPALGRCKHKRRALRSDGHKDPQLRARAAVDDVHLAIHCVRKLRLHGDFLKREVDANGGGGDALDSKLYPALRAQGEKKGLRYESSAPAY